MADIRCSHCGNNNPDFLDVCQFCQSPLKPESMLHIGEEPTKKNTGELEEILPDWLKDARQQGKNEEAADDILRSRTQPKVPKEEPPDLLAGLMSQADSDEDEVPDWLAGIAPTPEERPSHQPPSTGEEETSDFFAQFRQPEPPVESGPSQEDAPAWMGLEEKPSDQKDELTDWFRQAPGDEGATPPGEDSWMKDLGPFDTPGEEQPAEKEPEDLSWLRDLEAASKGTGELPAPKKDTGFDFVPSSSDEDLSWLNKLGGVEPPAFEEPDSAQAASPEEDLDWLNKLGGISAPSSEEPVPSQTASSEDDLSWLNNLGGIETPAFEEPASAQAASPEDDLDWLNKLGGTTEPSSEEPAPVQPSSNDLNWLTDLGISEPSESSKPAVSAFAETGELYEKDVPASSKPFRTAPLNELLNDDSIKDTTPDWLKNALEEPSMPPPGAVSMDWFSEREKSEDEQPEGPGVPTQEEPASSQPAFDFSPGDSAATPAPDLDALFDMEMPDWLSRETESVEAPPPETGPAAPFVDESLAPVELPSWVQAMRPVDSSIGEAAGDVEQITEREGPLAGFSGVIPSAPIGSSLRPKAFSLKLQATEEQQAGASLLEQIIAGETTVQPRKAAAGISSQKVLRWALSGLFLIVLGMTLVLGSQFIPIVGSNQLSDFVSSLPDSSSVLVVVDYEPSFAGELEAAAGPLLDQLALSRRSTFTFISMSPNGSALVDRLMTNTGISGLGYQPGSQYFNLGFLPGGSAGALGFIEDPAGEFSNFQAVVLMTDNAETGRVWVEQLEAAGPDISGKPLIVVSSAQSGPLLQPYVSSGQVDIMVNGLYDAAKYEYVNNTRPGTARAYWDAFGVGLTMAIIVMVLGSAWSALMKVREKREQVEKG